MWERSGFDSWVGKICWRREQLPIPVFRPGEFHGLHSLGSQRVRPDFHFHKVFLKVIFLIVIKVCEIEARGIRGHKNSLEGRLQIPHTGIFMCSSCSPRPTSLLLVSGSYYNKLSHTAWLETTEIYFLTILEDTSLKSRCWQSYCLWRLSGRILPCLFQLLVAVRISWIHWLVTTSLRSLPPSSSQFLSCLPNLPCVSLKRTLVTGVRAHLIISSSQDP